MKYTHAQQHNNNHTNSKWGSNQNKKEWGFSLKCFFCKLAIMIRLQQGQQWLCIFFVQLWRNEDFHWNAFCTRLISKGVCRWPFGQWLCILFVQLCDLFIYLKRRNPLLQLLVVIIIMLPPRKWSRVLSISDGCVGVDKHRQGNIYIYNAFTWPADAHVDT